MSLRIMGRRPLVMPNGAGDESGMSLMEILIAMLLLVGVGFGIFGSLISAARLATPTPERYTAANIARERLENFTNEVRQDTFNTGPLALGTTNLSNPTYDGVSYDREYTVTDVDIDGDLLVDYRKTEMAVCWQANGSPCVCPC